MRGRSSQNIWILVLLMLAGVVLGGFIAKLVGGVSALSWLAYGNSFGLSSPLMLDLGVLTLQFGLTIRFTIAGIIGYSGSFSFTESYNDFQGQTILPFPFFGKTLFYEKYGSFLEKNIKSRYVKM